MENPHKSICSHCKIVLRDGIEPISHGICYACYDKVMAKLVKKS